MKKLIIAGDSLSMPRPKEGVSYEDTYPALLQTALGESWQVINRSRRANSSRRQAIQLNLSDDIHDYQPQVFVYHVGTADCAPRLFSEFQQKILDHLPATVQKNIISFFSKRRLYMTRKFPKVYVSKSDFAANVLKAIQVAKEYTHVIYVIGIGMQADRVLKRSFGFKDNILEYNSILRQICLETGSHYIDTVELLDPELDLLKDGIHYNISANRKVFKALHKHLINLKDVPCFSEPMK